MRYTRYLLEKIPGTRGYGSKQQVTSTTAVDDGDDDILTLLILIKAQLIFPKLIPW